MEILSIQDNEWLKYATSCTAATFYHTPIWHRVWQRYEGYCPESKIIQFQSGRKALIPISRGKDDQSSETRYFSSPEGTYGGPITSDTLSVDEIQMLFDFTTTNALTLRQNPYSRLLDAFQDWQTADFTQAIDLSQGWSKIFSQWDNCHRKSLRKGLRAGVCCGMATTQREWQTYYEVYLDTVRRWENPLGVYEWQLFDILRSLDDRYCKLWLAYLDRNIIAGKVAFYFNKHAVIWHGASLTSSLSFKPNQVLHYFILRNALSNQYRFYDFDTSAGLEGVIQFKNGFGAQKLESNIYSNQS